MVDMSSLSPFIESGWGRMSIGLRLESQRLDSPWSPRLQLGGGGFQQLQCWWVDGIANAIEVRYSPSGTMVDCKCVDDLLIDSSWISMIYSEFGGIEYPQPLGRLECCYQSIDVRVRVSKSQHCLNS